MPDNQQRKKIRCLYFVYTFFLARMKIVRIFVANKNKRSLILKNL